MRKLFPRLVFDPCETPLSWATRLAVFHSGQHVVPFLTDLGIRLTDLNHGHAHAIDRLCEVTGEDPLPVWHNTASPDGHLNFRLRGEPLPSSMLLGRETRFCPLCLAEDDREGHGPIKQVVRGYIIDNLDVIGNPDVDTLLEHLHRIAPAMETVPTSWATMTQAAERARITMHILLDLLLNDQLKNIGRASGSSGFSHRLSMAALCAHCGGFSRQIESAP